MGLINCTLPCVYQKDGACQMKEPENSFVSDITSADCLYFTQKAQRPVKGKAPKK